MEISDTEINMGNRHYFFQNILKIRFYMTKIYLNLNKKYFLEDLSHQEKF